MSNVKEIIESGKAYLGIEFGSTRIKAVLIDEEHNPIAPSFLIVTPYSFCTFSAMSR